MCLKERGQAAVVLPWWCCFSVGYLRLPPLMPWQLWPLRPLGSDPPHPLALWPPRSPRSKTSHRVSHSCCSAPSLWIRSYDWTTVCFVRRCARPYPPTQLSLLRVRPRVRQSPPVKSSLMRVEQPSEDIAVISARLHHVQWPWQRSQHQSECLIPSNRTQRWQNREGNDKLTVWTSFPSVSWLVWRQSKFRRIKKKLTDNRLLSVYISTIWRSENKTKVVPVSCQTARSTPTHPSIRSTEQLRRLLCYRQLWVAKISEALRWIKRFALAILSMLSTVRSPALGKEREGGCTEWRPACQPLATTTSSTGVALCFDTTDRQLFNRRLLAYGEIAGCNMAHALLSVRHLSDVRKARPSSSGAGWEQPLVTPG